MGGGVEQILLIFFFIVLYLTLRYKICYILKMHILETHGVSTSIHPIFSSVLFTVQQIQQSRVRHTRLFAEYNLEGHRRLDRKKPTLRRLLSSITIQTPCKLTQMMGMYHYIHEKYSVHPPTQSSYICQQSIKIPHWQIDEPLVKASRLSSSDT